MGQLTQFYPKKEAKNEGYNLRQKARAFWRNSMVGVAAEGLRNLVPEQSGYIKRIMSAEPKALIKELKRDNPPSLENLLAATLSGCHAKARRAAEKTNDQKAKTAFEKLNQDLGILIASRKLSGVSVDILQGALKGDYA